MSYLEVENLSVTFGSGANALKAVDGISFSLDRGEILALVGESGSGKSMTSLSVIRLLPPAAQVSGRILIDGTDTSALSRRELEDIRGSRVGMVFQEPMTSLNPVLTIRRQITEGLRRHRRIGSAEAAEIAVACLSEVGIADPKALLRQYPHQLSGGMRQRVAIASALTLKPGLLIADEPTTALDVTVQAQVLDLLVNLKQRFNSGILLITHDIGVVAETADRVAVMRHGRIVEIGPVEQVLRRPGHEYTRSLLSAHMTVEQALSARAASMEERA